MRDYAEIGWRVHSGRRRDPRGARGPVERVWRVVASPTTTSALLVLSAVLLLLEARGSGAVLPVSDPGRLAPMALRVVLVLLGTNLLALFLQRALPALLPRRARATELAPELALEHRAALPFVETELALERVLEGQGLRAVRRAGERRALGVRGAVALLGAAVAVAGGVLLLGALVAAIDDPAAGELALLEGESVETLSYDRASADPLEVFLGLRFSLHDTPALLDALEHGSDAAAVLQVEHPDGGVERVALRPASSIGLPDGSWLRLASVRRIGRPVAATVRVVAPGGEASEPQKVLLGRGLRVGAETLQVSDLRSEFLGGLGPAVELTPAQGRPFWIFARAPALGGDWPHMANHRIELLELEPSYVVTLERFVPQGQTLPVIGLALLVLGGCLLLATSHLAVEVHDEVDRVVVRTSSLNNARGAVAAGEDIARAVTRALEDGGDRPEETSA